MNAVKHGLRAQTIILPNERQEDFDQIHNSLRQQYDPQNPTEQLLVDAAVIAQWKVVRAEVYETAAYDKKQSHLHRAEFFRGMIRAQNSLARLYSKAYDELERIKTARQKAAAKAHGGRAIVALARVPAPRATFGASRAS
jgi:hypothetical protein